MLCPSVLASFIPLGGTRTYEATMVEAKTWVGGGRESVVVLLKLRHAHSKPALQGGIVVDRDVVLPSVGREEQGLISRQLTRVNPVQQCTAGDLQARCVKVRFGEEISARHSVGDRRGHLARISPLPDEPGMFVDQSMAAHALEVDQDDGLAASGAEDEFGVADA